VHFPEGSMADAERKGDEVSPEAFSIKAGLSMLSDEYKLRENQLRELIDADKTLNQVKPCMICNSRIPDSILEPCNHGGMCIDCCDEILKKYNSHWPFCRGVRLI